MGDVGRGLNRRSAARGSSWARVVGGAVPFALVVLALVAAVGTFVVEWRESPKSAVVTLLYATLVMFAGNYIALPGQAAQPSPTLAIWALISLLVTFSAAVTALFSLTSRARAWLRARYSGRRLVVLGSGSAAANILRSHRPVTRRSALLVTGDERGPAALAAGAGVASQVVDLHGLSDVSIARLAGRGRTIALATDDDEVNIGLARRLALARARNPAARCAIMAMVCNQALAEALRPPVVDAILDAEFGISCPDENIAERITHELDAMLRRAGASPGDQGAEWTLGLDGDGSTIAVVVERWLRRFTWSRTFLGGQLPTFARLRWEADPDRARIVVVVRENSGTAAAHALERLHRTGGPVGTQVIAVTDAQLVPADHSLTVIDREAAAWDERLVFDDIKEQWGRIYHAAYNLLWESDIAWDDVHDQREGHSSILAGQNLLRLLADNGYVLVRTAGEPAPPTIPEEVVASIAEREHAAWLTREWIGPGGRPQLTRNLTSSFNKPWSELAADQRDRNVTLTRVVIPALAAWFGYEVRTRPAPVEDPA